MEDIQDLTCINNLLYFSASCQISETRGFTPQHTTTARLCYSQDAEEERSSAQAPHRSLCTRVPTSVLAVRRRTSGSLYPPGFPFRETVKTPKLGTLGSPDPSQPPHAASTGTGTHQRRIPDTDLLAALLSSSVTTAAALATCRRRSERKEP